MKYIKLFENELNLKKYLVDDGDDESIIYLWEFLNIENDIINLIVKYQYNTKLDKLSKINKDEQDILNIKISRFKRIFNIVYQTNSLKDAKEKFFLLIDTKNYNL